MTLVEIRSLTRDVDEVNLKSMRVNAGEMNPRSGDYMWLEESQVPMVNGECLLV